MNDKPSEGALLAAREICEKSGPEYGVKYDELSIEEFAGIIDEQTGLKDLIEMGEGLLSILAEHQFETSCRLCPFPIEKRALEIFAKAKGTA